MRAVNKHPTWENQPLRLSEDERQNLFAILEDFFNSFHLRDIREILWDWLAAALSSESCTYESGRSRSNLLFVYEKLETLIEAAHGIARLRKRKRKWRHRKWKATT